MVEAENEQYNEDELCAPDWMDKKYFEKLLRDTNTDESIEVVNLVLKPGSKAGDHYASIMFRAAINYNTKNEQNLEKSLMIKTMPFVDGPKKEMLEGMNMFDIEIKMYKEVIPKFEKMLKEIGDNTQLSGKCLHSSSEPYEVLVFEDLSKDNYKTVTTWGGNLEISKGAIEKLAKWHALSFKMVSDGNTNLQTFTKNGFTDGNMLETPTFKYGFKNFVDMIKREPELQQYSSKFEKIVSGDPFAESLSVYRAFVRNEKASLFVLNHGDFHIKNLMFKGEDDGKVDDVRLVDFQMCIWGPAVIDLTYMLYMMMDEERIPRRQEMIHYYFEIFSDTLKKLKYTGEFPKLADIYKDFITYRNFELFMLTTVLPLIIAIKEDPLMDIGAVLHGDEAGKALYEIEAYVNYVKKVLPSFLHNGYLD
ncbi:hypothetical protein ACFFRR_010174 [Megaselia abdita]